MAGHAKRGLFGFIEISMTRKANTRPLAESPGGIESCEFAMKRRRWREKGRTHSVLPADVDRDAITQVTVVENVLQGDRWKHAFIRRGATKPPKSASWPIGSVFC